MDVDGNDRFFHVKDIYGSTKLSRGDTVLYEPCENYRGLAVRRVALSGASGAESAISMDFGIGKKLLGRVKNAQRSVKIVSPYLSAGYVKTLVELEQRGVEVTLVTADDLDKDGKADRALIGQVRQVDEAGVERRARGAYYSLIVAGILFGVVAVCGLVLALLGYPATAVAVAVLGGGFIVSVVFAFSANYFRNMRVYSYAYYATLSRVCVFMSSKNDRTGASEGERVLVHAKAYVIDDEIAYVGSLNFSYAGFNLNYEVCTEVRNPVAVRRLSERIDTLYENERLARRDLYKWGRSLHPEPKNDGESFVQFLRVSARISRSRS